MPDCAIATVTQGMRKPAVKCKEEVSCRHALPPDYRQTSSIATVERVRFRDYCAATSARCEAVPNSELQPLFIAAALLLSETLLKGLILDDLLSTASCPWRIGIVLTMIDGVAPSARCGSILPSWKLPQ